MSNKCDNQSNKSYFYFVKLNLILDKMQKYMEKKNIIATARNSLLVFNLKEKI